MNVIGIFTDDTHRRFSNIGLFIHNDDYDKKQMLLCDSQTALIINFIDNQMSNGIVLYTNLKSNCIDIVSSISKYIKEIPNFSINYISITDLISNVLPPIPLMYSDLNFSSDARSFRLTITNPINNDLYFIINLDKLTIFENTKSKLSKFCKRAVQCVEFIEDRVNITKVDNYINLLFNKMDAHKIATYLDSHINTFISLSKIVDCDKFEQGLNDDIVLNKIEQLKDFILHELQRKNTRIKITCKGINMNINCGTLTMSWFGVEFIEFDFNSQVMEKRLEYVLHHLYSIGEFDELKNKLERNKLLGL